MANRLNAIRLAHAIPAVPPADADDLEDGLARWTVTGPPPAPDSRKAVVATEDTLYFGSGFE